MPFTHDQAPKPKSKPVQLHKVDTFAEAMDYALGGFHASIDKASTAKGPSAIQWDQAAGAYFGAYTAMTALQTLPGDEALPKAKELLHQANEEADAAVAKA